MAETGVVEQDHHDVGAALLGQHGLGPPWRRFGDLPANDALELGPIDVVAGHDDSSPSVGLTAATGNGRHSGWGATRSTLHIARHGPVPTHQDDELDDLPLVVAVPQEGPRLIAEVGLVGQFVDDGHEPQLVVRPRVHRVGRAGHRRIELGVGQADGGSEDRGVQPPLVSSAVAAGDPIDDDLPVAGREQVVTKETGTEHPGSRRQVGVDVEGLEDLRGSTASTRPSTARSARRPPARTAVSGSGGAGRALHRWSYRAPLAARTSPGGSCAIVAANFLDRRAAVKTGDGSRLGERAGRGRWRHSLHLDRQGGELLLTGWVRRARSTAQPPPETHR